mgnify:CR=1 FL=1
MKYCANCKKAFADDSYKVCPHCGGELESVEIEKSKSANVTTAESKETATNENEPTSDERQKIESRGLFGFLLIVAGIALIIGAIVIWNLSDNKELRDYVMKGLGDKMYYGQNKLTGTMYAKTAYDILVTHCYIPVITMPIGAVICLWIGSGLFKPYLALKDDGDNNKDNNNNNNKTES